MNIRIGFPTGGFPLRQLQDIAEGATVRDAINAAGITGIDNCTINMMGQPTTLDAPITEGAQILIAKQVKGNLFSRFLALFH